jgi:hypothetical protein
MRITKIKRAVALTLILAAAGLAGPTYVSGYANDYPSTGDLMFNELKAALFQEFGETTPENVEEGKKAISLIFHDSNRDMRLIGAYPPLLGGFNNLPSDSFELRSLRMALNDDPPNTSVERIGNRWYYRRSIPLSNTMHQACVLCHTNFTPEFFRQTKNTKQMVGALMLRVPIENED